LRYEPDTIVGRWFPVSFVLSSACIWYLFPDNYFDSGTKNLLMLMMLWLCHPASIGRVRGMLFY
jgi:hypothetical protein